MAPADWPNSPRIRWNHCIAGGRYESSLFDTFSTVLHRAGQLDRPDAIHPDASIQTFQQPFSHGRQRRLFHVGVIEQHDGLVFAGHVQQQAFVAPQHARFG